MNLSEIFYNGPRIEELFSEKLQNTVLFSSPGTGKTTTCLKILENYDGPKMFFAADTKFGKDQALELSSVMEYSDNFLVVFDEGVNMTSESQNTLRSLTNNDNYIFLICTNEIGKMSNILLDRFIKLDCNIPKNQTIMNMMQDWLPDNLNEILKEENLTFKEVFSCRFNGSMRSFLRDIENRNFENLEANLSEEFIMEHFDVSSIVNHVFNCWLSSSKKKEYLKEITDTIYKMSFCNSKEPFLRYLLEVKKEINDQV